MSGQKTASWLGWTALGILAIYAAFWALYTAGEIMAGNWAGLEYALPSLLVVGLMYWCWKHPVSGGLASMLAGVLLMMAVYSIILGIEDKISAALVIGGPFVLAGALCVIQSALNRSPSGTQDTAQPPTDVG